MSSLLEQPSLNRIYRIIFLLPLPICLNKNSLIQLAWSPLTWRSLSPFSSQVKKPEGIGERHYLKALRLENLATQQPCRRHCGPKVPIPTALVDKTRGRIRLLQPRAQDRARGGLFHRALVLHLVDLFNLLAYRLRLLEQWLSLLEVQLRLTTEPRSRQFELLLRQLELRPQPLNRLLRSETKR